MANAKAIEADARYRDQSPEQGFYRVYMAHNHHMLAYAAIMRGQSELAIKAINNMVRGMPGRVGQGKRGLGRRLYGDAAGDAGSLRPLGRSARRPRAAGIPAGLAGHAALRPGRGLCGDADVEKAGSSNRSSCSREAAVPAEARVGNNAASDVLAVAEMLLAGEILVRAGNPT